MPPRAIDVVLFPILHHEHGRRFHLAGCGANENQYGSDNLQVGRNENRHYDKSYSSNVSVISPIFHRRLVTISLYLTSNRPGRVYK